IKKKAFQALKNLKKFKPFKIEPPLRLELTFVSTDMTQMAELVPGVKRIDGRTISFVSNDFLELYKAFYAMIVLAGINL
ncbi:MAG: M55 family metallopeptidase, partial [Candidatus Bathyarchaeia archaeon]